ERTLRLRVALISLIGAAGLSAGLAIAQAPAASAPATASDAGASTQLALPTPPATNPQPSVHPNWSELTVVQQRILAPFAPEWN
ncbi:hypothetical protein ACQKP3_24845, partial [Vibrio sp. DNB22_10_4]